MNPSYAIRILAACGVALAGPMTPDALAFARAVDIGSRKALLLFAQENPQSVLAEKARRLSEDSAVFPMVQNVAYIPVSPDAWLKKNQNKMMKLVRGGGGHDSPGGHSSSPGRGDTSPSASAKPVKAQKVALQQQVVSQINTSLKQFERDTDRCRGKNFGTTQSCVADALEKFSRGLGSVTRAPGSVTPIAIPTLREAAKKIRKARNKREARAAIAAAVPVIRKSINLIMAGDEDTTYRLQVRQRSLVIKSLSVADDVLVKATGI